MAVYSLTGWQLATWKFVTVSGDEIFDCVTMAADPLLLYTIQNDRGEDAAHPNAARLYPSTPGKVMLADVLSAFPYWGTGSFHFRFQALLDRAPVFLDFPPPGSGGAPPEVTPVPLIGGNVVCKVLRLDALASSSGRAAHEGAALRVRVRPRPRPAGGGGGSGGGGGASPRTPAPVSAAAAAAVAAMLAPAMDTGGAHHEVPKEVDGETHIRDTGEAHDIYGKLKATDARGMRPVRAVAEPSVALPVPVVVDADLEGKSDFVKAAVMARRSEARAKEEAARAEREAREAVAASEEAALAAARGKHEARVREWGHEQGGSLKPLRVLITTLPNVLWEGAKWEPVPMAKLVQASRVKIHFMKAVTVVHPDKAAGLGVEKAYIASQVFSKLEESWRKFQEEEMKE
jgi:hypothetical protein